MGDNVSDSRLHEWGVRGIYGHPGDGDRLGLRYHVLDSGCCGMAGGFGFEAAHYGVSMAVGERVLLPAVRAAGNDELVLADGFSCREQIAQATSRRALHLAEVVHLAMTHGPAGPAHDPPEWNGRSDHARATLRGHELAGGALVVAGLATAAFALRRAGR